jgi:hypothetical protein
MSFPEPTIWAYIGLVLSFIGYYFMHFCLITEIIPLTKIQLQQRIKELQILDDKQQLSHYSPTYFFQIQDLQLEITYLEDKEKKEKNAKLQRRDPLKNARK